MNRSILTGVGITFCLCGLVAAISMAQNQSREIASCQSNLKQYSMAILMYQQDYDEMYPPMKLPAQVQNRVYPYVKRREVFSCPTTGKPYLPNPALNYVPMASIASPASTMMLRDALPHNLDNGGKGWNIAYCDGHVKLSAKEIPLGKPAPTPSSSPAKSKARRAKHK